MIKLPPPYKLRAMTVDDLPAVLAIERASFPTAKKEAGYRYEITENSLAHYHVLMQATVNTEVETLLGYAGYWNIADEVHISIIAVDPTQRRRGFGQLLLLNILYLALEQGSSLVTLEVRRSNSAAQQLYDKYEFQRVGLRRRYYSDTGEDAILMTVNFADSPGYRPFLQKRERMLHEHLTRAP